VEKDLYEPMVTLLNLALDKLCNLQPEPQGLEVDPKGTEGTPIGGKGVVFVITSGKPILGQENAENTKPDIVLVTFETASRIHKRPINMPRDNHKAILTQGPQESIHWYEVLSAVEIQRPVNSKKIQNPPSVFQVPKRMDRYTYRPRSMGPEESSKSKGKQAGQTVITVSDGM
jgi:hypothetical protein